MSEQILQNTVPTMEENDYAFLYEDDDDSAEEKMGTSDDEEEVDTSRFYSSDEPECSSSRTPQLMASKGDESPEVYMESMLQCAADQKPQAKPPKGGVQLQGVIPVRSPRDEAVAVPLQCVGEGGSDVTFPLRGKNRLQDLSVAGTTSGEGLPPRVAKGRGSAVVAPVGNYRADLMLKIPPPQQATGDSGRVRPITEARSKIKAEGDQHQIMSTMGASSQTLASRSEEQSPRLALGEVDNIVCSTRPRRCCPSNIIKVLRAESGAAGVSVTKRECESTSQSADTKGKNPRLSSPVSSEGRIQLLVVTDGRYSKLSQEIQRAENLLGQYDWEVNVEQRVSMKLEDWENFIEYLWAHPKYILVKFTAVIASLDDFTSNHTDYMEGRKFVQRVVTGNVDLEDLLNKMKIVQRGLLQRNPDNVLVVTSPLPMDFSIYNSRARQKAGVPPASKKSYEEEQRLNQVRLNNALIRWRRKLINDECIFNLDLSRRMMTNNKYTYEPSDNFKLGVSLHRQDMLEDGWHLSIRGCEVVWRLIYKHLTKIVNKNRIDKWKEAVTMSK